MKRREGEHTVGQPEKRTGSGLWAWLLELLFPTRCLICQRLMERQERLICSACLPHLPYAAPQQKQEGYLYHRCAAAFLYREPLREAFLAYKFSGQKFAGATYGSYIAEAVERELSGTFDLITWVPLSRLRRFRRGYDQSQLMAEVVARQQGMPLVPTLHKVRRTRVQSHLAQDEARRKNVAGAYRMRPDVSVAGARVLLIDDICTSGATLDSCAQVLLKAGAADVVCAVLARR